MDVSETLRDRLKAALRELDRHGDVKSKRAQLEEVFDEVEARLSQGVRRKHVMAALQEGGLVFTLRSFETTYARIKKRRERNSGRQQPTALATPSPEVDTPRQITTGVGKGRTTSDEPTGFHGVAAELARRQNGGDPRRNE